MSEQKQTEALATTKSATGDPVAVAVTVEPTAPKPLRLGDVAHPVSKMKRAGQAAGNEAEGE